MNPVLRKIRSRLSTTRSILFSPHSLGERAVRTKFPPAMTRVSRRPSALPIGLTDILAIDGIARQLGIEEPDSPEAHEWRQILLLKALESGGSVIKTSNILGSRIRYAGGAVGHVCLV